MNLRETRKKLGEIQQNNAHALGWLRTAKTLTATVQLLNKVTFKDDYKIHARDLVDDLSSEVLTHIQLAESYLRDE